jgi:hypothetical protein
MCVAPQRARRAVPAAAASVRRRTAAVQRCKELAKRDVSEFGREKSSRGRFATPADFALHDCSPYFACTRTPRTLGICPSFKDRSVACQTFRFATLSSLNDCTSDESSRGEVVAYPCVGYPA